MRNWQSYGTFTGPDQNFYVNQEISPATYASNLIRNVALHITIPRLLNDQLHVAETVTDLVQRAHRRLGISPTDPRTTLTDSSSFAISPLFLHEDLSAAPFHLLLGVVTVGLYGLGYRSVGNTKTTLYVAALLGAGVLFCLLLKWQPWHNRLHLPLFVLSAPLVGYVLVKMLHPVWQYLLAALMLFFALLPLFFNVSRPLVESPTIWQMDRWTQYFVNQPASREPYANTIAAVRDQGCTEVGLIIGPNSYEYPFWMRTPLHVEHVNTNLPGGDYEPCAVIAELSLVQGTFGIGTQTYSQIWEESPLAVFIPDGV
jgi:hypothetical protein